MEFSIRPLNIIERKYTYAQSMQLEGQTGNIGRLRGDFDSGGYGFYTTWDDRRPQWKTDEFKAEFDNVINTLRSAEYGLLKDRPTMVKYVRNHPDSSFKGNYTTEYGFRVDTEKYAYLIRCNPVKGDYNFYCFCYIREYLDRHIENTKQDIRFIDSGYKELFRLPDGERIVITLSTGERLDRSCRYIDETHLEVGDNLYHICEFAELMERNGNTYAPKETPLPPMCYSVLRSTGELILIKRWENGYYPCYDRSTNDAAQNREFADDRNAKLGVSKAQEEAMLAGSLFSWDAPGAKPKSYDENGKPIKPKNKDYER